MPQPGTGERSGVRHARELGLQDVAAHLQAATAAAGLNPPSYYGSEVVARFLGLRYDHPAGTDQLELFPYDPITRAEAAWSLAQVLGFGHGNVSYARQTLSAYQLAPMSSDQRATLRIAVSRIGYPYVYAGTTDDTSDELAHGGFDCSGFVCSGFVCSGFVCSGFVWRGSRSRDCAGGDRSAGAPLRRWPARSPGARACG